MSERQAAEAEPVGPVVAVGLVEWACREACPHCDRGPRAHRAGQSETWIHKYPYKMVTCKASRIRHRAATRATRPPREA